MMYFFMNGECIMLDKDTCGIAIRGLVCCDKGVPSGARDNDYCTNCDISHCRVCDFHTAPELWRIQGHITMMLLAKELLSGSIAELERYNAMGIDYGK